MLIIPSVMPSFFSSPALVFTAAFTLRLTFLLYGLWQDANSPLKYTDIDYYVFTDAARYVARGRSPYARDTYRYTPLLAWLLLPTTWGGAFWFSFGKILFAVSDLVAGWLIVRILKTTQKLSTERALKFASIWLLNPMVATISTRGSSEGMLGVMVVALLWAVVANRISLAGILLGLAVHFKIYPFIYGASILWSLDDPKYSYEIKKPQEASASKLKSWIQAIERFTNPSRINLTITALATFSSLNVSMYILYGLPFIDHTYLYHFTRIDHRHNFSPYNTLLYLSSSPQGKAMGVLGAESFAFVPQLFLSAVAIPWVLGKKDLGGCMLAQTFAFVTFNKVCTSQVCCCFSGPVPCIAGLC